MSYFLLLLLSVQCVPTYPAGGRSYSHHNESVIALKTALWKTLYCLFFRFSHYFLFNHFNYRYRFCFSLPTLPFQLSNVYIRISCHFLSRHLFPLPDLTAVWKPCKTTTHPLYCRDLVGKWKWQNQTILRSISWPQQYGLCVPTTNYRNEFCISELR